VKPVGFGCLDNPCLIIPIYFFEGQTQAFLEASARKIVTIPNIRPISSSDTDCDRVEE
jgi:hypothetical protein